MLSRRNIRIKVMQILYSLNRDGKLSLEDAIKRYRFSVGKSFELYLYALLLITKVSGYALKDASKRSSKHLPSDEDKAFRPKFFTNQLTQSLVKNDDFQRQIRQSKLEGKINQDAVRLLYIAFAKKDQYKNYINTQENSLEDHRKILLDLLKFLSKHESFNEEMEEKYPSWKDDKSLILGSLKRSIKSLPPTPHFFEAFRTDEETIVAFGERLLTCVEKESEDLLSMIEPILKNWDADRVAIIDMILIKMALCELMVFPTIPTKVTLNEFVEIAKLYSTDKSKDFINGILDRLMKKLIKEGKIKKEGRGLNE